MTYKKIYFVGFMGSGKSTVGKLLADALGMGFIDLDDEVVKRQQRSINAIFREEGEDVFRRYESELLKEFSVKEGLVFSTGGGIIGSERNWQIMNSCGVVVFLACSWPTVLARLEGSSERPLVNQNDLESLKALYESRQELYRRADVQIDVDELTPEEVVLEIKQKLAQG
ncbi:shikimate kinase [Desulfuromonas acetoxidans]|uniref:Shikimate kinase n=1 Tax=Desulfuromonas acetoxidans (strain DSM 684 / 11070) TaxID=281689 RepID=Q1K2X5_DESA6|nr:shikimate kinase [Desulfuromonas acetoxidans]EAT16756.1 Shikimate kinase [Desulfuromonas acetoxidans DSM 684]MBF0644784.1 shikimate kinase [Desulfuromonas acetoxidans]NVD23698.1 shikimate kinase [Desulfuromonas acetoxidans]NVE15917.1 shikimate kinase [Desulfuromonas acetoxidans]